MKHYFIGGGNIRKNELEEIDKRALSELDKSPKICVFLWTSEDPESEGSKKWMNILGTYFKKLGAEKVTFPSILDSIEKIKEEMANSDMIYIPGGNTESLLNHLKEKGVAPLIRSYKKIISGNSAGAICLCKDSILLKNKDRLETKVVEGIGMVDFSVAVHYDEKHDDELIELSKERKIYAIPEKRYLVFEGTNFEFINDIYLFFQGEKEKLN